jgi:hypothetical protein
MLQLFIHTEPILLYVLKFNIFAFCYIPEYKRWEMLTIICLAQTCFSVRDLAACHCFFSYIVKVKKEIHFSVLQVFYKLLYATVPNKLT